MTLQITGSIELSSEQLDYIVAELDARQARREAERLADESVLSTAEACEFLRISETKLWHLVRSAGLPVIKDWGRNHYLKTDLLAYAHGLRVVWSDDAKAFVPARDEAVAS